MIFIERLTLWNWLGSILPSLVSQRGRVPEGRRCYVIDASRLAMGIARMTAWIAKIAVERLAFRIVDVRDETGQSIWYRIIYQDAVEAQTDMMNDPVFRAALGGNGLAKRLPLFLAKHGASASYFVPQAMGRALLVLQVCAWKRRAHGRPSQGAVVFLERRPWFHVIERHAARCGLQVVALGPRRHLDARRLAARLGGPSGVLMLYVLRNLRALRRLRSSPPRRRASPRLAVTAYGHCNLTRPELKSDLFFWEASAIPGRDVLLMFRLPQDPLSEQTWAELLRREIEVVVLHPGAAAVRGVPLFTPREARRGLRLSREPLDKVCLKEFPHNTVEVRWLRERRAEYLALRAYWAELFAMWQVKVFVSWTRQDPAHCALADALEDLGGVTAMYQHSYEPHPSPEMTAAVDVFFGFSQTWADFERQAHSMIRYYVTTGYLHDHRFRLWRTPAQRIRQALRARGAQRILAYFDENSTGDARWQTGHEFFRENYAFLLEKVLAEPSLGVVLKPKRPITLRERLGPVAALLTRAEATGRVYLFEEGIVQSPYPPAAAALASDLAINGHLGSATAGVEAALAGVPTLLLDRDGWPASPFYRLGVGRVVFTDWPSLWHACLDHWRRPGGLPGLGDWSPMLNELDPFRDGRAAERMGTYVRWLLEGFKAGRDREAILADAAERYAKLWGRDKIIEGDDPLRHEREGVYASRHAS